MRTVSLDDEPSAVLAHTFVVYGDTRTGKTEFGATFPRPIIIGDSVEGGYKTIKNMDRSKWFEEDVKPEIRVVENMNDLAMLLPQVRQMIAAHRVYTIVFDAWSFYADFFLTKIKAAKPDIDNRQAYGALGDHLNKMRVDYHALGVNVVWACLAKHPDEDDKKGRPLIPGKSADKFAAGVDFLLYSRINQLKKDGKQIDEYEIRTKQYGPYIVGNREGIHAANLVDPFTAGTYAEFIRSLGYDPEAIRAAMPKPGAIAAAPAKPAAPPVKSKVVTKATK